MNNLAGKHRMFLLLLLLWALVYLLNLSGFELGSEETRRIYPAETMLASGDWFNPVYSGELYNRKPPLFNWLIAIALSLCGSAREFAVHLPGACSILPVLAWLVYAPSAWLTGRARWLTALLFLSSIAFYRESRSVMIDAPYAAATALALLSWLDAWSMEKRGLRLWLPAGFFLGVAMLLKGPAALLLFYLVIFFVCRAAGSLRLLLHWSHAIGLGFALGLFGLWIWARVSHPPAFAADPGALHQQMFQTWWTELSQRYLKGSESGPFSPLSWLKGIYGALLMLLPWLFLLPRLWQSTWENHPSSSTSAIVRGGRIALVVFAAAIFLMPMTRARYFLPAHALILPLTALILCQDELKFSDKIVSIWRRSLYWAPVLMAILSFIAAAAIFSTECRQRFDLAPLDSVGLVILGVVLLVLRGRLSNAATSPDKLALATCFCLIAACVFNNLFGQQISQGLHGESRPAAEKLMNVIPAGESVCFVNIPATPAYLFYLQGHAKIRFLRVEGSGSSLGDMSTCARTKLDEKELRKALSGTSHFVTAKSRKSKPGEVGMTAESLSAICGRPCRAVLVFPYDKKQLTLFSCKD